MKNINLKQLYGKKYKFRIDKKQMFEDREIDQEKIPTGEEWYQNLLCQFGEISLYGGSKLIWICTSKVMANKFAKEHPEILILYFDEKGKYKASEEEIFYFDIFDINKVFEYAHPRRKRKCHLSPEQIAKFAEGGKVHQFQKKKG